MLNLFNVLVIFPVIAVPTVPTTRPTTAPSLSPSTLPTARSYSGSCPAFSVTNTNSATQNYATCAISLCGGYELSVSVCSSYSGDTYLRLVDAVGNQVAYNDNYCASGSAFTVTIPASYACQTFYVREGCFLSSSCSGTATYTVLSIPTTTPTRLPSVTPSIKPSLIPTGMLLLVIGCPSTHIYRLSTSNRPPVLKTQFIASLWSL